MEVTSTTFRHLIDRYEVRFKRSGGLYFDDEVFFLSNIQSKNELSDKISNELREFSGYFPVIDLKGVEQIDHRIPKLERKLKKHK
jgi:hypothetical protein